MRYKIIVMIVNTLVTSKSMYELTNESSLDLPDKRQLFKQMFYRSTNYYYCMHITILGIE